MNRDPRSQRKVEIIVQWLWGGDWTDLQRFINPSDALAEVQALRDRHPDDRYQVIERITTERNLEEP